MVRCWTGEMVGSDGLCAVPVLKYTGTCTVVGIIRVPVVLLLCCSSEILDLGYAFYTGYDVPHRYTMQDGRNLFGCSYFSFSEILGLGR